MNEELTGEDIKPILDETYHAQQIVLLKLNELVNLQDKISHKSLMKVDNLYSDSIKLTTAIATIAFAIILFVMKFLGNYVNKTNTALTSAADAFAIDKNWLNSLLPFRSKPSAILEIIEILALLI